MNPGLATVAAALAWIAVTVPVQAQSSIAAPVGAVVKPGLWETTATIEDAAASARRTRIGQVCVAAGDASNPQAFVPRQREDGMRCENRNVKVDGANVSWDIACKSSTGTTASGSGRLTIGSQTYLGSATLDVRPPKAKAAKLQQSFSGKWLKACS